MLSKFFESQSRIKKLCDGPTGHLIESFARVLAEAAYANITARRHLRTAEHFLYWIRRHGIKVRETNEQVLMRFANHFSQCQCPDFSHADQVGVIGGAQLFASHLRDIGIIAAPVRQESKDPELLVAFGHWMRQQRGTCDVTLSIYSRPVRELLARIGEEPSRLQASMLRDFVLEKHRSCGWAKAKKCTTALRMFLRFLIAKGYCAVWDWKQPFPLWLTGVWPLCLDAYKQKRWNVSLRRAIDRHQ